MKNFLQEHYEHYYVQLADGQHVEVTRNECLALAVTTAPGETPTVTNPYKQRWHYDVEAGYIIRLTRDEKGEALYRANAAAVRGEERYRQRQTACIRKGKVGCNGDCGNCQRDRVTRTVELDKSLSNGEDGEALFFEVTANDDFAMCEERDERRNEHEKLHAAILQLPAEHQQIVLLHFFKKKTQPEIAVIMNKDQSSVSRQLQTAIKNLKKIIFGGNCIF